MQDEDTRQIINDLVSEIAEIRCDLDNATVTAERCERHILEAKDEIGYADSENDNTKEYLGSMGARLNDLDLAPLMALVTGSDVDDVGALIQKHSKAIVTYLNGGASVGGIAKKLGVSEVLVKTVAARQKSTTAAA